MQKELAAEFSTSQRTINRVLVEAGLLTPVSQLKADAYNVMQALKRHNIHPSKVEQVLSAALSPLSQADVVNYLYDLPREQITDLFFDAMMHKGLDSHLEAQSVQYQKEVNADALPF